MKSFLFVNPLSGHYSAGRFRAALHRLRGHGLTPEVLEVRTPAEIAAHCTAINRESSPPLVIVAGGDGSINAVVNGLAPGVATLAVLPFGTSNVLAAELGIGSDGDGIDRIAAGRTAPLSVGVIEFEGRTLRFLLMAGVGLDGAVVRDVRPAAKRLLKQGAYALSALQRALAWDDRVFSVASPAGSTACHTFIACKASRYGGNFVLSPGSSPFTPGLAAVCVTGTTRCAYLRCALALFRGRAATCRDLARLADGPYEIDGRHPIQVDGDFVGYTPARIGELSDFARIVI